MNLRWRTTGPDEWTARTGAILLLVTSGPEGWLWSMTPATGAAVTGRGRSLADAQDEAEAAFERRCAR